jgi:hypothetical protein
MDLDNTKSDNAIALDISDSIIQQQSRFLRQYAFATEKLLLLPYYDENLSRFIYLPKLKLTKLKHITVSEENYEILRRLGYTSDSMNDVITVILNKVLAGDSWRDPQPKTQVPNGDESTRYVIRRF